MGVRKQKSRNSSKRERKSKGSRIKRVGVIDDEKRLINTRVGKERKVKINWEKNMSRRDNKKKEK